MSQYYFSAGPAVLPRSVLKQAQASLLDIDGRGTSILELSHRSQRFEDIIQTAEELLRELMAIPDHYRVLFLQGGASTQFSMLPLNVARGKTAYYQVAGHWGKKAYLEALTLAREIEVKPILLASSEVDAFEYIPIPLTLKFSMLKLPMCILPPIIPLKAQPFTTCLKQMAFP